MYEAVTNCNTDFQHNAGFFQVLYLLPNSVSTHNSFWHLHLRHLSPSVQLNNKLLIVSRWWGLPSAIFICLENNVCLWEIKLWILKSLSISCVRCCSFDFFLRHKTDLEMIGSLLRGPTGALEVKGRTRGFLSFPVRLWWTAPSSVNRHPSLPRWECEEHIFFLKSLKTDTRTRTGEKNVRVP